MSSHPAPILSYDRYVPQRDRRGFLRAWLGFGLGAVLICVVRVPILLILITRFHIPRDFDVFDLLHPVIADIGQAAIFSSFILPFALWGVQRIKHETRFVSLRHALVWGLCYTCVPGMLIDHLLAGPLVFELSWLGWLLLFPIFASFWLCRRNALRD